MEQPPGFPGAARFLTIATVRIMDRRIIGWLLVGVQVLVYVVLALLPWRTPSALSTVLAVPFVIAGGWLGLAAFGALGSALTPTPVPVAGAGLRTHGPYSRIRHPIYTAVLLLTAAAIVAAGTGWSLAWTVIITGFFWAKSRWEDRLLAAEYGQEWQHWAQQTGALIPRRRRPAP
jgi:protein-S-isoprenylcysteine O-methyltransferase Ste14